MTDVVCRIVDAYVFRLPAGGPEFLLLHRAPGALLAGTWQAVHGHIEPGETAWQAALREIREETGLAPLHFYQIDAVNTFYLAAEDVVHHCPCFAAEVALDAAVALNPEHDAYEWLAVEQAVRRFTWPGQRRAVREIVSEIIEGSAAKEYLRIPVPRG